MALDFGLYPYEGVCDRDFCPIAARTLLTGVRLPHRAHRSGRRAQRSHLRTPRCLGVARLRHRRVSRSVRRA